MKRNATVTARCCAMIALGLLGYGCSSGSTGDDGGTPNGDEGGIDGGPAGSTDSGRDGTPDTGQASTPDGGRDGAADTGQGGTPDGSQDGTADGSEGGLPMCNPAPTDMSACNGNPPCAEGCGVNISALSTSRPLRTCTCSSGGRWSCPGAGGACVYPTDVDLSCLQLPTPLPACPLETPDGGSADSGAADAGASLVRTGTSACTLPSSEVCGGVCGSATSTVSSYRDSTGVARAGYCVCIAGIWQCASASEWPTLGGG